MLYETVIRQLLYAMSQEDPEKAHEAALKLLAWLSRSPAACSFVRSMTRVESPRLSQTFFGITFPNPVGLAAGFDKNATALHGLASFDFGSIEGGTITRYGQPGNERTRMFRFPEDHALINRMGFNNDGADAVAERLARTRNLGVPLGINIGKSKVTPLEEAAEDYTYSLSKLLRYADYVVINVSSPNTPGLRTLQDKKPLSEILRRSQYLIREYAKRHEEQPKPLLVKIAPDLTEEATDDVVEVGNDHGVSGYIATNTTITRDGLSQSTEEVGGLSGRPLKEKARAKVSQIRSRAPKALIIGVGGIETDEDAWQMLIAGANLIQIYTSFIYGGPFTASRINRGLVRRLEDKGIGNIGELNPL